MTVPLAYASFSFDKAFGFEKRVRLADRHRVDIQPSSEVANRLELIGLFQLPGHNLLANLPELHFSRPLAGGV